MFTFNSNLLKNILLLITLTPFIAHLHHHDNCGSINSKSAPTKTGAGGFVLALENGLARTPPMGWLAWERFVCETNCEAHPEECINSHLFATMATRLVEDGFKQVGYEYVNIDDCWSMKARNHLGQLVPDPHRFPPSFSMEHLSAHIHSLGLKLGIYGDCGTHTCQDFPGQLANDSTLEGNYYERDAQLFASPGWSIDSFKFDGCYMNVSRAAHLCPPMGDALNATQRPMLFSCSWPAYENDEHLETNWTLVVEKCNLWRSFGDIEDSWQSVVDTIDWFVRKQELIVKYHGPGHWFDADQLVIGDFGLSEEEERAQMAIWCIWATPLYMSNDLRSLNKQSSRLLRNKFAIAVNQDELGIFGLMVAPPKRDRTYAQAFVKPVNPLDKDGCPSYAIVYFDRRTLGNGRVMSFKLSQLIETTHRMLAEASPQWHRWSECGARRAGLAYDVFDLFENNAKIQTNLNLSDGLLSLRVNPSGVRMVRLEIAAT